MEENELLSSLCKAISEAPGRNTRIQVLSVVFKKDSDGKYLYSQDELLHKFKGITLYDVKQARKHASNDKAWMPIEPGNCSCKKLSHAQIKHFLDFLQYGGVMQDVATSVKLSTGRRATIPNGVRMVHKAEVIRLYTSACDKEGYMKEKGHPSERTLQNILNKCPASQRKSLAGLDSVASEGSDAFDELISVCKSVKNEELESLMKDLMAGHRYLKGDFHSHCSLEDCKDVADHCIKYTLSDPTEKLYQSDCNYSSHENSCDQCESLSDALFKITPLVNKHKQVLPNEEEELKYDINQSTTCINLWKSHILANINQEHVKKVLAEMDENTTTDRFCYEIFIKKISRIHGKLVWQGWYGNVCHLCHYEGCSNSSAT